MAMFEAESLSPEQEEPGIARHEVSEDGVNWRPYDPARDRGRTLHRRIEFAAEEEE
jgi:hypothetical protein